MFHIGIQAAAQPLLHGLVGHWKFTGNAFDSSGSGNNLSVVGATLGANRFGTSSASYFFNGSGAYLIKSTPVTGLSFTDNFSISLWCNIASFSESSYFGLKNVLVQKGPASTYNFAIQASSSTSISFIKRTTPESLIFRTFTGLSDYTNAWTHIVCVVTGGFVNLYFNGVYISQLSVSNIAPGPSDSLLIGNIGSITPFQGSIDDIRIYNRPLSALEVTTLHETSQDI